MMKAYVYVMYVWFWFFVINNMGRCPGVCIQRLDSEADRKG